jgi:predicted metal-dependent HD superfamily phosphohydrolase
MLSEALLARIRDLHSGPERGYHGWSHPAALLALFAEMQSALHDPLAVYCAILLHDAVYEPRRSDNEARSAALARELLGGVVPQATLARTLGMIEATAHHAIPSHLTQAERDDMARFLDMDRSILAAPIDVFDAYEAGVRHEYRDVPDDTFREARAKILVGFLARDRLYLSDWGRARFEAGARENLRRSIAELQGTAR